MKILGLCLAYGAFLYLVLSFFRGADRPHTWL